MYTNCLTHCGCRSCYTTFNTTCRRKETEFQCGNVPKGLFQSLKNKIMSMQNESFKLNSNRKSSKKEQDYYCRMSRKVNTLDWKLKKLEGLLLSLVDLESQPALGSRQSNYNNCEYSDFYDSVCSLLDLVNELKDEVVFKKHNIQYNNENSSKIYSKILALESELKDFSSYLDYLQKCDVNLLRTKKSFPKDNERLHKNRLSNICCNHDKLSKHNRNRYKNNKLELGMNTVGMPSFYYSKIDNQLYKNTAPLNVNSMRSKKTHNSLPFKHNFHHYENLNKTQFNKADNEIKFRNIPENCKSKEIRPKNIKFPSYFSNGLEKNWGSRNKKSKHYDNFPSCSCKACRNLDDKHFHNDSSDTLQSQKSNSRNTQTYCVYPEKIKNLKTIKTCRQKGNIIRPVYQELEVSHLQHEPTVMNCNRVHYQKMSNHGFECKPSVLYCNQELPNGFVEKTNKFQTGTKFLKAKSCNENFTNIPNKDNFFKGYYKVTSKRSNYPCYQENKKKTNGYKKNKSKWIYSGNNKKRNVFYDKLENEYLSIEKNINAENKNNCQCTKCLKKQHSNSNNQKCTNNYCISHSLDLVGPVKLESESSNECVHFYVHETPKPFQIGHEVRHALVKSHRNENSEFGRDIQQQRKRYKAKNRRFHRKVVRSSSLLDTGSKIKVTHVYENYITSTSESSSETSGNSEFKVFNCFESPMHKANNCAVLVTTLNNEENHFSNNNSVLKKCVESLTEIDNDICSNCLVKEKKVELSPTSYGFEQRRCKDGVRTVIKKEIVRCADCRNKFNSDINQTKSITKIELDLAPNISVKEDKYKHNTVLQHSNSDTTLPLPSRGVVEGTKDPLKTKDKGPTYLANEEAVSIFQTNLKHGTGFKNETVFQPYKYSYSKINTVDSRANKKLIFDDHNEPFSVNNTLMSEVPVTTAVKKKYKSSHILIHLENDNKTNGNKSNKKKNQNNYSEIPVKLKSSKNYLFNLKYQPEQNFETFLVDQGSQNIHSYSTSKTSSSKIAQQDYVLHDAIKEQNKSEWINLDERENQSKDSQKNNQIKNSPLNSISNKSKPAVNNVKDDIHYSKKYTLDYSNLSNKNKNLALESDNILQQFKNPGVKGYHYSNREPSIKKYKNLNNQSHCNCITSSSTSKMSSFSVSTVCDCRKLFVKKNMKPTFNVGRKQTKPYKFWRISYSKPPARLMNNKNRAAGHRDDIQTTSSQSQALDDASNKQIKASDYHNLVSTVTSESSFSMINWALIAKKLKEENSTHLKSSFR